MKFLVAMKEKTPTFRLYTDEVLNIRMNQNLYRHVETVEVKSDLYSALNALYCRLDLTENRLNVGDFFMEVNVIDDSIPYEQREVGALHLIDHVGFEQRKFPNFQNVKKLTVRNTIAVQIGQCMLTGMKQFCEK